MPIFQDLRVRLQTRRNNVANADHLVFSNELTFFLQFIKTNPFLNNLLKEIPLYPDSVDKLAKEIEKGTIRFPRSELEKVSKCKSILEWGSEEIFSRRCAIFARYFARSSNYNDCKNAFVEVYLNPFYDYLDEHIVDCDSVLYLLWKFKHRCEWFDRSRLHQLYINNTSDGENLLKQDLQKFLFDQGIDYPFSEPLSPSGRTDIVADLQSKNPLVLELKLFDSERSKDKNWVRKGFRQILQYAKDYNKSTGYLVVLNLVDTELFFKPKKETDWPPRINVGDKTLFLITINLKPIEISASKQTSIETEEIDEDFLLS
jgi:hypothetical protein